MSELMQLPLHVIEAAERAKRFKKRGHAGQPGEGPEGETCKTCRHATYVQMSKRYHKCALTRHTWTGGPGSDIRLKDPACQFWEGRIQE